MFIEKRSTFSLTQITLCVDAWHEREIKRHRHRHRERQTDRETD